MLDNSNSNTNDMEKFICFEDYDKVPGFVVSQTAHAIRKTLAKSMKTSGFDITPQEFAILNRLATHPKLNQRMLAELTYKDRPAVTRMLSHLMAKGLVAKQTSDNDRRAYLVVLTKKGKELRDCVIPVAQSVLRKALKGARTEDLEITLKTLQRITTNLDFQ